MASNTMEILQLTALTLLFSEYFATELLTTVKFSAFLAELNSTANPQLTSLTDQPTTSRHFNQLNC
jgi:hypothetical protein